MHQLASWLRITLRRAFADRDDAKLAFQVISERSEHRRSTLSEALGDHLRVRVVTD
jgi:hypothetical protein